jgi:hypothetical protein
METIYEFLASPITSLLVCLLFGAVALTGRLRGKMRCKSEGALSYGSPGPKPDIDIKDA